MENFKICYNESCKNYGKEQPISNFSRLSRNSDGYETSCKDCVYNRVKKYHLKNLKKGKTRNWENKTLKARFRRGKHSAESRNIPWLISFDQFCQIISCPCFYCQNILGKPVETSAGLDRINNDLEYFADNLVSCCNICNRIKNQYLNCQETLVAIQAIIKVRYPELNFIPNKIYER